MTKKFSFAVGSGLELKTSKGPFQPKSRYDSKFNSNMVVILIHIYLLKYNFL